MKARAVSAMVLTVGIIIAAASEASAGVSVDPGELSPEIYLHVRESTSPQRHDDSSSHRASARSTEQKCENMLCRPLRCLDEPDGTTYCFGQTALIEPETRAELTPGDILEAVRRVGLPRLGINVQPSNTTLVNFDTIFYANPQAFARSISLLGYDIDLRAEPVSFTWHHGDGTSHTTRTSGRPYPSKEVTYRYRHPAKRLNPSVDVTYRVRYRVDGEAWQSLTETLNAAGPAGNLEVKEAGAVLADH